MWILTIFQLILSFTTLLEEQRYKFLCNRTQLWLNLIIIISQVTVKNIWKSYIWTADKDVNESDPRSNVHYLGSSENKAWKKKFRLVRDPVQAWIFFFRPYFHYCLSSAHYCEDHFHSQISQVFACIDAGFLESFQFDISHSTLILEYTRPLHAFLRGILSNPLL